MLGECAALAQLNLSWKEVTAEGAERLAGVRGGCEVRVNFFQPFVPIEGLRFPEDNEDDGDDDSGKRGA